MSRNRLIADFLRIHGYDEARAAPLAQDASLRSYLRVTGGSRPAVLMDAPPPENIRPFLQIADHIRRIGLSVPEIIAADSENGLLLEEDFGDQIFSSVLKDGVGKDKFPLFDDAVDALVAMQRAAPPLGLPAWDAQTMARTAMETLFDWWWPATYGAAAPTAARREFSAALEIMLVPVATGPRCFVHRDYFAGNLVWMPGRHGTRRVGVLDFQAAAIGHPAYDLASLLQDARSDLPTPLGDRAVTKYLAARPELDPENFIIAYDACAAQRHLRVAAQWVRLAQRDGRPRYLAHGPRTWRLLGEALDRPAAAPLAEAMDRWIPLNKRANPPGLRP